MQKLSRFTILGALFVLLFFAAYCALPLIVMGVGGSFTAVAHNPAYASLGGIIITVFIGRAFYLSFDEGGASK